MPKHARGVFAPACQSPDWTPLPEHLRPRLRLLLTAMKLYPDGRAWAKCWRFFRRLEGREDAPISAGVGRMRGR